MGEHPWARPEPAWALAKSAWTCIKELFSYTSIRRDSFWLSAASPENLLMYLHLNNSSRLEVSITLEDFHPPPEAFLLEDSIAIIALSHHRSRVPRGRKMTNAIVRAWAPWIGRTHHQDRTFPPWNFCRFSTFILRNHSTCLNVKPEADYLAAVSSCWLRS